MSSMRMTSVLFAILFSISAWAKLPGANTSMPEEYNSAYMNYDNSGQDPYYQENYYNAMSNPTGIFSGQGYQVAGMPNEITNLISILKSPDLNIFQKIMKGIVQPILTQKLTRLFPTGVPQINLAGLSPGQNAAGWGNGRQNCNAFQNNQDYRSQSQAQRFQ